MATLKGAHTLGAYGLSLGHCAWPFLALYMAVFGIDSCFADSNPHCVAVLPCGLSTLLRYSDFNIGEGSSCQVRRQLWSLLSPGISKLCESMYTRFLAGELAEKGIAVNSCCPG